MQSKSTFPDSPAQLKADVASLQQFIAATHPDLRHSADPVQLQQWRRNNNV